jgi:molybdopterin-guanine dinucleotide biosynthesis protein A
MTLEAVVLTGGKSRRMGQDKARLQIDGVPQGVRIVSQLAHHGIPVTVLGREPIYLAKFVMDKEAFGGPIAALRNFQPTADAVFVVSCDLPKFDARLIDVLQEKIGAAEACAPHVDGFRQPLCALYTRAAFGKLSSLEDQCAMGWLNALETKLVSEEELKAAGVDPATTRGANTPEEFAEAVGEAMH